MQFSQDIQLNSENKFNIDRLFGKDSKEFYEQNLQKELDYLDQIKKDEYDQLSNNEVHQKINYTFQTSKLIQFDYKLIFQNYQGLFSKVRKIKIINNLKIIVFLTTIDQIGFFDIQQESFWLQHIGKDFILDIDYDEQENIFILGRKYGKVSFGVYSLENKKIIINSKDDLEGISGTSITHVKFAMSIDLIFVMDDKGVGSLLIRKSKKLRYKLKKIIIFEKDRLQNIAINQLLIKSFLNKEQNLEEIIDVLIALTNSKKAFLIQVRIQYEKKKLKKVYEEKLVFKKESESDNDKQNIIVLMDKNMWLFESYDYLLIIFPDKIFQYFIQINPEDMKLEINLSFELLFNNPIQRAFIGAPEQLVIIDNNYEIYDIYLNKLRYKMLITELDDQFFQNKQKLNFDGINVIIGEDLNKKSFCFFSENMFQYYFIFSWKTYIKNLLNLSLNLEAIQIICDLVDENPSDLKKNVFLKDVYFIQSTYQTNLDYQQQKIENYKSELQNQAKDVFDCTLNSSQLKEDNSYILVFFIVKLLIKSNNQSLLFDSFIFFVQQYKINDEKFLNKFILSLLYFQDKSYGKYYKDQFIETLFDIFLANQKNKNLRKFIYTIHNKLDFNLVQQQTIEKITFKKSLDMYLFYMIITKPSDLTLFNNLEQKIFESQDQSYFLKFMIILYDIFHSQKILQYNMYEQQQKESYDTISYKKQLEDFFIEKFDLFIFISYKRVIWMFIEIYKNLYTKLAFPQNDMNMMINGIQPKYSECIQKQLNRNGAFQVQILPFVFYFSIEQAKFNDLFIEDVLKRVLNKEILNEASEHIDIPYLFDYIYDLYFDHRDQLRQNKSFKKYLEQNKDENKIIYLIILSDINYQIEQYMDLYLKKNWFFKVMKKNLKIQTKDDYKNSIQLIKKKVEEIISNNKQEFIQLLELIEPIDQLEIIKNIENDDQFQYFLIKNIKQKNKGILQGDNNILYFSLLCKFEPDKIIQFLEQNVYDVDKIVQVCEKIKNKRALGYLKYKLNQIQEAMEYYLNYIKYLWEQDDNQILIDKNFQEIQSLVKDVIKFQLDEFNYTQTLIQLLDFISRLPKRGDNIKLIIKDIFNSWVNINFPLFIQQLKEKRKWEHFKHSKYLISELLINMESTSDFNEKKRLILSHKGFKTKENFYNQKKKGLPLKKEQCLLVEKHSEDHKPSYKLLYHKCGVMVEKNCLDDQLYQKNICLYCNNIKNQNQINKLKKLFLKDYSQQMGIIKDKQVHQVRRK